MHNKMHKVQRSTVPYSSQNRTLFHPYHRQIAQKSGTVSFFHSRKPELSICFNDLSSNWLRNSQGRPADDLTMRPCVKQSAHAHAEIFFAFFEMFIDRVSSKLKFRP